MPPSVAAALRRDAGASAPAAFTRPNAMRGEGRSRVGGAHSDGIVREGMPEDAPVDTTAQAPDTAGEGASPDLSSFGVPHPWLVLLLFALYFLLPIPVRSRDALRGAHIPPARRGPSPCCSRSVNSSDARAGSSANVASIFHENEFIRWNDAAAAASRNLTGFK